MIIRIFAILIFLLTFLQGKAQNYSFDYRFTVSEVKKKKKGEKKVFVFKNSKEPSYSLHLFDFSDKGVLIDYKEKFSAYFFYKNLQNEIRISNREDLYKDNQTDEIDINFTTVEDLGNSIYLVKAFKQTRKRPKLVLEIIFTIKPAENDLLDIYFIDLSMNIHEKMLNSLKNFLGKNKNYFVESYFLDYRNGVKRQYAVNKIEKVNITLK